MIFEDNIRVVKKIFEFDFVNLVPPVGPAGWPAIANTHIYYIYTNFIYNIYKISFIIMICT